MDEKPHAIKAGSGRWHISPEAVEWLFTLAVLGFLFWQSAAFREPALIRGAGDRYQEVVEMKVPILPGAAGTGRVVNICAHFGGWLPEAERESPAGACASDSRRPITVTAMEEIVPSV